MNFDFEEKATASIRINFAMQLFNKLNVYALNVYNLDFRLF